MFNKNIDLFLLIIVITRVLDKKNGLVFNPEIYEKDQDFFTQLWAWTVLLRNDRTKVLRRDFELLRGVNFREIEPKEPFFKDIWFN